MLKRIITAIVAICVMIPVLMLDHTWVLPIAVSVCTVIGIWEMLGCTGFRKNLFLTIPLCLVSAIFPVYARFLRQTTADPHTALHALLKLAMAIAFIMALYIFGVAVFANKKVVITDAGLLYASCFYIIAAFTALIYIHDYINGGEYIYLLAFICAWITDIFAYFSGRLFGKHKLIPAVSPKKTVEGAIGGIIFCVGATLLFGFIVARFFDATGNMSANYLTLAISAIFISIVSQTGDLIMSVIKRHYGIKDYGKLFPGHGGVLDRFDSVLAVTMILAVICTYFDLLVV